MPRNKDLKRTVRARMQKTGEAYTAARVNVIHSRRPSPSAAPAEDLATLAGTAEETLTEKTGRGWQAWTALLDSRQASTMPHRDIAALLRNEYAVDSWWSQNITVGYERIKGLRERGQTRAGTYEAGKSRTYGVPVETLFDAWADEAMRRRWLGGLEATVRTATRPKSLRLDWPDGTIVVVGFTARGDAKSNVALAHQKLPARAASERVKLEWTMRLEALGRVLTEQG
ncbi:MAG TPA: hypothetical protein VFS30_12670 [Dehalococcoidia bacterium]|nr:hypothetical protein [Dehalococcoidia bacterium]